MSESRWQSVNTKSESIYKYIDEGGELVIGEPEGAKVRFFLPE
jgi:hypothetical protein